LFGMKERSLFSVVDTGTRQIFICPLSHGSLVVVAMKNKDASSLVPHIKSTLYKLENLKMFLAAVKGT